MALLGFHVTFLSSISFGTDRTCDTAFSLHSFRNSRSLRPSLPRTSLFSLNSISAITAGCPSASRKSVYTRNTISTRLPIIAAKRRLCLKGLCHPTRMRETMTTNLKKSARLFQVVSEILEGVFYLSKSQPSFDS